MRCERLQRMPLTGRAKVRPPGRADTGRPRSCRRSRAGPAGSVRMRLLSLRNSGTLPHALRGAGCPSCIQKWEQQGIPRLKYPG